jgi:hypothetical protein
VPCSVEVATDHHILAPSSNWPPRLADRLARPGWLTVWLAPAALPPKEEAVTQTTAGGMFDTESFPAIHLSASNRHCLCPSPFSSAPPP